MIPGACASLVNLLCRLVLGCISSEHFQHQTSCYSQTANCSARMTVCTASRPMQAMRSLPHTPSIRWPDQPFNYLRRTFPELSDAGLSLLNGLLTYDANKRMTAAEALEHQYFKVSAPAC